MTAWSLLAVPLCLVGMVLLLAGMSWFEQKMLSPRSLIVYSARSRHVGPDTVERLIAAQSEELLRSRGVVRVTTKKVAAAATEVKAAAVAAATEAVTPSASQAAPAVTRP